MRSSTTARACQPAHPDSSAALRKTGLGRLPPTSSWPAACQAPRRRRWTRARARGAGVPIALSGLAPPPASLGGARPGLSKAAQLQAPPAARRGAHPAWRQLPLPGCSLSIPAGQALPPTASTARPVCYLQCCCSAQLLCCGPRLLSPHPCCSGSRCRCRLNAHCAPPPPHAGWVHMR